LIKFSSTIFVNCKNKQISRHDVHPRGLSGIHWGLTKLTACFANIKLALGALKSPVGEGKKGILRKLIAIAEQSAKNAEPGATLSLNIKKSKR
jgi:hypothetical protein